MYLWYRNFDVVTLLLWVVLTVIGLMAIYSATHGHAQDFLLETVGRNFYRQLLWAGICSVGFLLVLLLPIRVYQRLAWPGYFVSIGLLVAALLIGQEIGGARSWIRLGSLNLQSSELAKVGTLLAVANLFAAHTTGTDRIRYAPVATGMILIPAFLIVLQNDLGTALVYLAIIPILLFWSGLPPRIVLLIISPAITGYLTIVSWPLGVIFAVLLTGGMFWHTRNVKIVAIAAVLTVGTLGTALFALNTVLESHQVARVISFTNPEAEEFRSGVGFHLVQSKAAIGSGGLTGKGFMEGTQTQGRYVPEQSTDFIFSVIGEEFGFIGAMVVLVLYAVFLIRLVRLAGRVKHPFGSLMAAGVAGILLIHVFINIGMVVGLLPVIGIPLPFLSYGGSALLANTTMLAIVLGLDMRRNDFSIYALR